MQKSAFPTTDNVESWLRGFTGADTYIGDLLVFALKKPLEKYIPCLGSADLQAMSELPLHVDYVHDWLSRAVNQQLPWLRDLNNNGIPKKLAKLGTLTQALETAEKETKKDFHRLSATFDMACMSHRLFDNDETRTVMTFPESGFHIARLSGKAVSYEGRRMKHCLKNKEYINAGSVYYSLRDSKNKSHVTLEVQPNGKKLIQCKDARHKLPASEYLHCLTAFIEKEKLALPEDGFNVGLVNYSDRIFSIYDLPEKFSTGGDLNLRFAGAVKFPDEMNIKGKLYIDIDFYKKGLPDKMPNCAQIICAKLNRYDDGPTTIVLDSTTRTPTEIFYTTADGKYRENGPAIITFSARTGGKSGEVYFKNGKKSRIVQYNPVTGTIIKDTLYNGCGDEVSPVDYYTANSSLRAAL